MDAFFEKIYEFLDKIYEFIARIFGMMDEFQNIGKEDEAGEQ